VAREDDVLRWWRGERFDVGGGHGDFFDDDAVGGGEGYGRAAAGGAAEIY
jgi:hypothetical protein